MKYDYDELRTKIHSILTDFYSHEIECYKSGEFDFEYMEFTTDDILRLIQDQEGKISTYEKINKNESIR